LSTTNFGDPLKRQRVNVFLRLHGFKIGYNVRGRVLFSVRAVGILILWLLDGNSDEKQIALGRCRRRDFYRRLTLYGRLVTFFVNRRKGGEETFSFCVLNTTGQQRRQVVPILHTGSRRQQTNSVVDNQQSIQLYDRHSAWWLGRSRHRLCVDTIFFIQHIERGEDTSSVAHHGSRRIVRPTAFYDDSNKRRHPLQDVGYLAVVRFIVDINNGDGTRHRAIYLETYA
jgi:hypothetical protein